MPKIPFAPYRGNIDASAPVIGANPGAFAQPGAAIAHAGREVQATALNLLAVQKALSAEQAKLDVEDALSQTKLSYEKGVADMVASGVRGDQYAQKAADLYGHITRQQESTLSHPEAIGLWRRKSRLLGRELEVKALHRGVELTNGEILADADTQQRADINRAVNSPDAAERERAFRAVLQRPDDLFRRGVISGEAFRSMRAESHRELTLAGIDRDSRSSDPATVDRTLALLDANAYPGLKAQEQANLATGIRTRINAEEARALAREKAARDALDRSMREQGEEAERRIVDRLRDGTMTPDYLQDVSRLLTSEKLDHYDKVLKGQALSGVAVHPETVRRLTGDVYRTNVTPEQIAATTRDVELAFEQRRITIDQYKEWKSHLQSLSLRKQTEGRDLAQTYLSRRHQQTEQNMRAALRTTSSISLDFDASAEEVLSQALEDLTRNSAYFGKGNEDPEEWWNRRKAFYVARVSDRASTRLEQLRKQTRYPDFATTNANRGAFASEADYYDQVRLWKEIRDLERETARLKTAGPAPKPATPNPAGAPATPANRLGR